MLNTIDFRGDSLSVTKEAIETIFNGLKNGKSLHMKVNNGMIDPESIKEQTEKSDDLFLNDLYEIASNKQTVEMSVGLSYNYKDNNNVILDSNKDYKEVGLNEEEVSPLPLNPFMMIMIKGNGL